MLADTIKLRAGLALRPAQVSELTALLVAGGAVPLTDGLADRVRHTAQWALVLDADARIIACAALKYPERSYRTRLSRESGCDLSRSIFPFELGYLVRHPDVPDTRIASLAMRAILGRFGGGVFATTTLQVLANAARRRYGFTCFSYQTSPASPAASAGKLMYLLRRFPQPQPERTEP